MFSRSRYRTVNNWDGFRYAMGVSLFCLRLQQSINHLRHLVKGPRFYIHANQAHAQTGLTFYMPVRQMHALSNILTYHMSL